MGFFVFDDTRAIPLDDRVLAHLQIVIVDKLRRHEADPPGPESMATQGRTDLEVTTRVRRPGPVVLVPVHGSAAAEVKPPASRVVSTVR